MLANSLKQLTGRWRYQLVISAYVAGLMLHGINPKFTVAIAVAVLVLMLLSGDTVLGIAVVGLVLGFVVADLRLTTLDNSELGSLLNKQTSLKVQLLEHPSQGVTGTGAAVAVSTGIGEGEHLLLQARDDLLPTNLRVGEELLIHGKLVAVKSSQHYLQNTHIHAVITAQRVDRTGSYRGGLAGLLDGIRARSELALQRHLPQSSSALLRGMVLGQDQALSVKETSQFRVTGLAHILAASGQNIALLCALALPLLAALGVSQRGQLAALITLILLYIPLAGSGPSIQRAGVMGAVTVVALFSGRATLRWYLLLLAAAATLTLNPYALKDIGWQLSFAAVISIFLLQQPLVTVLTNYRLPRPLSDTLSLTLAATVGTAPLIAHYFQTFSLISLLANMLAGVVVGPITWLGMLAAFVGQFWLTGADIFNLLCSYPLGYLQAVAGWCAGLPWASQSLELPVALMVCIYALLIGLSLPLSRVSKKELTAKQTAKHLALASGFIAVLAFCLAPRSQPLSPGYYFLDIGQGDATLITDGVANVLVDTGPADGPLLNRLDELGVQQIDLLVLTHPQADHYGQAAALIRQLPVKYLLDGASSGSETAEHQTILRSAKAERVKVVKPIAGDQLTVGRVSLQLLWPTAEATEGGGDPNDSAVVLNTQLDGLTALLTADAESNVLNPLQPRSVDVLKVSHHGSADPGLPELLKYLQPKLAVIEVGRGNTYGHPNAETVSALRTVASQVLRTDRDGTVVVKPSGDSFEVSGRK